MSGLEGCVTAVADVADPVARAKAAGALLAALAAAQRTAKDVRRAAVVECLDAGWTEATLAEELGVARPRVYQLAKGQASGRSPAS